jgi:molybdopterin-containing oxidoreductase family iron-sulfur binding subunit
MNSLIQINAASVTGKRYWRSLDELDNSPEFRQWVEREFQENASEMLGNGSRRQLLKLMAASFGLAGLTACRRPEEKILPLARSVEDVIPGKPLHYATVASTGGAATGLIVEVHDGRPTKVEGNPRHPYSLGATSAHMQALVLGLYDPDRAHRVHRGGKHSSWDEFGAFAKQEFTAAKQGDGSGLRILAERSSSPTLARVKGELTKAYPKSQWIEYDSVSFDNARLGAQMVFGQALEAHYQYDKAEVVFALDCDFLGLDSPTVLPTKQFSSRRKMTSETQEMNRLYVAEAAFSVTGAMADNRLRLRASDAGALATMLAKELNLNGAELKVLDGPSGDKARAFVKALAKDLQAHKGASVVVAGPRQPAAVHALVALINQALGNNGATVVYTKPVVDATDSLAGAKQLVADLNAGAVKTLVILGGNPVNTFPADLDLAAAMKKATTVALCADENETWAAVDWQLPEAHPFECWGDARALDGTASVQQPLIEPMHGGKSALELAAWIAGMPATKPYELVKATWTSMWPAAEAGKRWNETLHEGANANAKLAPVAASADLVKAFAAVQASLKPAGPGIEVAFYPSWGLYDGRFANNAWMQEAPEPMTKVVWDNAALLSANTAKSLGVKTGDVLTLSSNGKEIKVPAMIQPGQADNSIALALGYGRTSCGRVGQGVGHRVEGLRTTASFGFAANVQVTKAGGTYELVTTQEHHTMEGRAIVLEATLEHYQHHPDFAKHAVHAPPSGMSMFPGHDYTQGNQWGMTIDLNACIGCNACVVACQAENNIPVVGKDQVQRGREMHWIRMDRYFTGAEDDPQAVIQPMACQQCENAPCESVCPVAATAHSPEGLNEMAYNRCVGTRYCANNCPYKVRRFNFLNWHKQLQETEKMAFNPDVTVRMRGVMEKCNYCVQRIQEKKLEAKAQGRRQLKDGEVMSACQQVCPADAIVFGNINDPESQVSKSKKNNRDYELLAELNNKTRTTYLAKLRNPNPELA